MRAPESQPGPPVSTLFSLAGWARRDRGRSFGTLREAVSKAGVEQCALHFIRRIIQGVPQGWSAKGTVATSLGRVTKLQYAAPRRAYVPALRKMEPPHFYFSIAGMCRFDPERQMPGQLLRRPCTIGGKHLLAAVLANTTNKGYVNSVLQALLWLLPSLPSAEARDSAFGILSSPLSAVATVAITRRQAWQGLLTQWRDVHRQRDGAESLQ